jgi:heme-degrading monooxygenase HmoA
MIEPHTPPPFRAGQVITIFRSWRRAGSEDTYGPLADQLLAAARTTPGFVDFKTFVADDGERVSLVTFADADAHRGWRDDARHREAQQVGRTSLYDAYIIQVGECDRVISWSRAEHAGTDRARPV